MINVFNFSSFLGALLKISNMQHNFTVKINKLPINSHTFLTVFQTPTPKSTWSFSINFTQSQNPPLKLNALPQCKNNKISNVFIFNGPPTLFGCPAGFLTNGPLRHDVGALGLPLRAAPITLPAQLLDPLLEPVVLPLLLLVLYLEGGKIFLINIVLCLQFLILGLEVLEQRLMMVMLAPLVLVRGSPLVRPVFILGQFSQFMRAQLFLPYFFDFHQIPVINYLYYRQTANFNQHPPIHPNAIYYLIMNPNQKDIRTQMLEALAKYNIKQVDVAREAGIHHSTLSLWLQGKVKGHHIKIQDTLAEWLDSLYSGRPRYTTLNKTVDKQFVLTPLATNILKKHMGEHSEQVLIPIHFDLELDGKRYKEQFCWNINDPYFTPQQFAHLMVTQNPALAHFQGHIRDTIRKAIASYRPVRKQVSSCIRTLELDVKIDSICLKDRFEWDINDQNANPQDFAAQLVQELNLNSQFMVKIAHQIREQLEYYRKNTGTVPVKMQDNALLDIKKSTRNLISLSDNPSLLAQDVHITPSTILRRNNEEWQPKIQILDAGEVRKFQKQQERQNRYARRAR